VAIRRGLLVKLTVNLLSLFLAFRANYPSSKWFCIFWLFLNINSLSSRSCLLMGFLANSLFYIFRSLSSGTAHTDFARTSAYLFFSFYSSFSIENWLFNWVLLAVLGSVNLQILYLITRFIFECCWISLRLMVDELHGRRHTFYEFFEKVAYFISIFMQQFSLLKEKDGRGS
jgi:hypothetical protein